MISQKQFKTLAESFGLFARGCKKIRSVLLELAEQSETQPETPETPETRPETPETKEIDSILTQDFSEAWEQHIFSTKFAWSKLACERFFQCMVRDRLRANNQGSVWVHKSGDLENRKNWRKIKLNCFLQKMIMSINHIYISAVTGMLYLYLLAFGVKLLETTTLFYYVILSKKQKNDSQTDECE